MSRRETVVNTLLGIFLVAVFLLPFLLFFVVAGYVLQALDHGARYLLPGVVHYSSSLIFLSLLCLLSLVYGVTHLRRRRWQSAFLSFAILPMIVSVWFADVHSPLGRDALWMWPAFLIVAIPTDSRLTRFEFIVGASTVAAAVSANTGLLGSGSLARTIADCVLVGLFTWFVIDVRQRWSSPKTPGPEAPPSPNHA